jgi:chromosome segregation and condensation protein ScpB
MSDSSDRELTLPAQLEGLLFVAAGPVGTGELAEALGVGVKAIERARRIGEAAAGAWLETAASFRSGNSQQQCLFRRARAFRAGGRSHLSRPALETLAIIAYSQPATCPQIDAIRGVNRDHAERSTLKGLIYDGKARGLSPTFHAILLISQHLSQQHRDPQLQAPDPIESADEMLKGISMRRCKLRRCLQLACGERIAIWLKDYRRRRRLATVARRGRAHALAVSGWMAACYAAR